MNSASDRHILSEFQVVQPEQDGLLKEVLEPTSDWLEHPERWNRSVFVINTTRYLQQKNGGIDTADAHLVSMLATQIDIYVESILKLRKDGLVITFNGGFTVGPNPHMAIADRALYRSLQVMKELELSPKAREGYKSARQISPEVLSLLEGA